MQSRCTMAVRVLGLSLLVLALSPVTAPFSSVDLWQLLDESRPSGEAILQSKVAATDSAVDVTPASRNAAVRERRSLLACGDENVAGRRPSHPTPLRI